MGPVTQLRAALGRIQGSDSVPDLRGSVEVRNLGASQAPNRPTGILCDPVAQWKSTCPVTKWSRVRFPSGSIFHPPKDLFNNYNQNNGPKPVGRAPVIPDARELGFSRVRHVVMRMGVRHSPFTMKRSRRRWKASRGRALVRMSASWSAVGQYSISMMLRAAASRT